MLRRRLRQGKISWVTSLATAGLVGAAGIVGTMTYQNGQGPESAPARLSSAVTTDLPAESPRLLVDDEEPTVEGTRAQIRAHLSDESPTASLPGSVQSSQDRLSAVAPASPFEEVEVFYATDRDLIDFQSALLWMRIFLPSIVGLATCIALGIGVLRGTDKWIWGAGLALGCILTALFSHHAWIYGMQAKRLYESQSVLYGTRRYDASSAYPLHLGKSKITIPRIHQKGHVERPKIYEFKEDPNKHVMLHAIAPLDEQAYFDELHKRVQQGAIKSAFVFIHGYNVQFSDALLRTAQIKKDLEFSGPAILYSWPSHGDVLAYSRDGDNAAWTGPHLEQFLKDIKQRTGAESLHVIAHSMGNRALVTALERLALDPKIEQPILNQVVMAAPDVDLSEFESRYAKSVDICSRQTTLYTSSTDRALLASMRIHGYPRLGLSQGDPKRFPGVDTIEVSPVDPSLLGHSYYGSHPLLIKDLQAIIELGEPPNLRQWLIPYSETAKVAWRFSPRITAESSLQR